MVSNSCPEEVVDDLGDGIWKEDAGGPVGKVGDVDDPAYEVGSG